MRKIILMVVGLVTAIFGLFGVQLGLTTQVSAASLVGGLLIIAAYVFTEFKKDWADFVAGVKQETKWSDPAFWTATIGALIIPLSQAFGFTLSESVISIVSALLAIMVPVLISFFRKTTPVPDVPVAVASYLSRFKK
jgi:uncharacterized membrane protein